MAKSESIYTVLENHRTETSVKGIGEFDMILPSNMPTAEEFADAEKLSRWATENGIVHACLQKGVQKHLIDLRARFRLVKKDETWNLDQAQKNVDSYEWSTLSKPNEADKKKIDQAVIQAGMDMARAMQSAGLEEKMIMAALMPVYGSDGADQIWAAINEN